MQQKRTFKPPIRIPPLRNPGESLERQIDKLANEDAMTYAMVATVLVVIIAFEWVRYAIDYPPSPVMFSIIGIFSLPIIIYRIIAIKKKLKNIQLGRDGEKAVGQDLELLREAGAKVFHDIPATSFNLDHVIISVNGIFVVETKTYSKASDGGDKILFDGTHITLGNGYRTEEPLIQARSAARWLHNLIKETTGKQFHIRPVIVFPGWYIEAMNEAKSDVWVLNPKALPAFISNNREQLSEEDVTLVAYHLSTYIRGFRNS